MTIAVSFCAYDKPGLVGGTSSWIQWLLPALQARGFKIRCYVFLHTGEKGPVTESLERDGIECVTTRAQFYTEERVRWLLHQLSEDPCIVFVPNEVQAGYLAARWARQSGISTVGVLHSDGIGSRAIQQRFIFGSRAETLDAAVCVSEFIEQHVRTSGSSTTRLFRIPCGADIPAETVIPPDGAFRVAYVGRLAEEAKRISAVVSAFCNAAQLIPDVEFVVYGDGPERAKVEKQIATEGLGLPVTFGGTLEAAAMQTALLKCHATVLLSDYEGLPLALMEAMACGSVPVCLRVPSGIPELVHDGETGLLVDDRGQSFIAAIKRLREDTPLWQKLSEGARRHVEAGYSHEGAAEAWAKLLQEVAPAGRRSSVKEPRWLNLPSLIDEGSVRKPRAQPLIDFYRSTRMALGALKNRVLHHNYTST